MLSSVQKSPVSHYRVSTLSVVDLAIGDTQAEHSPSSAGTPVSSIFDRESIYSHGRNLSQSTAASSVLDFELKQETPSSPVGHDGVLHAFEEELRRTVPSAQEELDLQSELYTKLDRDLLLAPTNAFERTLWETTESDAQGVRPDDESRSCDMSARLRKPLPDVPRSASSVYSMEVSAFH